MSTWSLTHWQSVFIDSRATNMSNSYTYKMAAKTSGRIYWTKLRHCYRMYCAFQRLRLLRANKYVSLTYLLADWGENGSGLRQGAGGRLHAWVRISSAMRPRLWEGLPLVRPRSRQLQVSQAVCEDAVCQRTSLHSALPWNLRPMYAGEAGAGLSSLYTDDAR